MTGKLIGIAQVQELRAPLRELKCATVSVDAGIEGDIRGRKRDRQVTVLFRESWKDACAELGVSLPWTTRRANLFVEGVAAPNREGGRIQIGDVLLEVVLETKPCQLMERAHVGLMAALTPEWRGGVCCKVLAAGEICIGDRVSIA